MPKFAISAALATAFVALSGSVPANAEMHVGRMHGTDGKCFVYSRFEGAGGGHGFGFWSDCAQQQARACSEEGSKSAGYWGKGCTPGANNARAQPASARNTPRRGPPATASR